MFDVIDKMLGVLTERFSSNSHELLAFSTVIPDSWLFLNFDAMLLVTDFVPQTPYRNSAWTHAIGVLSLKVANPKVGGWG